eukprot:jgi/Mesen1/46/ME1098457C05690
MDMEVGAGSRGEDAGAGVGVEAEGGLVFTDTGEFCRSLQLDDAITRRAVVKDAFAEEDEGEKEKEKVKAAILGEDSPPPAAETKGGWTN